MSTRGIAVLSGSNSVVTKIMEDGTAVFGVDKPINLRISGNVIFDLSGSTAPGYIFVDSQGTASFTTALIGNVSASTVAVVPSGNLTSNNVQTALQELQIDIDQTNLNLSNSGIIREIQAGTNILVTGGTSATASISLSSSLTGLNSIQTNVITASIVLAEYFTGSHVDVDFIDFKGYPGEAPWQTGRLYYNTASNLLSVYTEYPNTHIHLGQQLVSKVQNDLAITIQKGKVVYITGSTSSDVPRVITASWENDTYSARTLGLVMADILPGERGYIILEGLLEGLNTNGFLPGQLVYLSSSGNITNIQPPAPFHEVRLGEVVRKQSNNGSIFVKVQNGYELSELHDVEIQNLQNGDLLTYSTSSFNQWINSKTLNGSYTITNALTASSITASSNIQTQNFTILGTASLSSIVNQATINFNSSSNRVEILPGIFVKGNIETTASISASSAQFGTVSASVYQGLPELYRIVTTTSVMLDSTQCSVFAKNTVSNLINITLPSAASAKAKEYYFIKADTVSGSVKIIASGSNLINGTGSFELNGPYQSVTLITDGSDWYVF